MPDEAWFACMTGDCEHATQAECDRWLRTEMIELAKVNLELETELQATSEALGEGDFDSISKHAAALRADLAAARSLLRDATRDTERLDWLDGQSWINVEKTDESDNNGVGLINLAVFIKSGSPDGPQFYPCSAATFREAIDTACAALSAVPIPAEEPKP